MLSAAVVERVPEQGCVIASRIRLTGFAFDVRFDARPHQHLRRRIVFVTRTSGAVSCGRERRSIAPHGHSVRAGPFVSESDSLRHLGRRADVACALLVALVTGALYVATLQPDLGGPEDTPKFQFLGYVLGTAHPPGYPLYVMLSHVFVRVVRVGTIAYRANLFSAVMAAIACVAVFAIGRLIGSSRWPSVCAAIGLAAGASFWRSAVFAEVYSLAAAAAGVSLALLLMWGARGHPAWLLGAIGTTAAGFGNHLTIVGVIPAYVGYVLWRNPRVLTVKFLVAAASLVGIGVAHTGSSSSAPDNMPRTSRAAPPIGLSSRTSCWREGLRTSDLRIH